MEDSGRGRFRDNIRGGAAPALEGQPPAVRNASREYTQVGLLHARSHRSKTSTRSTLSARDGFTQIRESLHMVSHRFALDSHRFSMIFLRVTLGVRRDDWARSLLSRFLRAGARENNIHLVYRIDIQSPSAYSTRLPRNAFFLLFREIHKQ